MNIDSDENEENELKTYQVRLEYHTVLRDDVEAHSEEEAIQIAQDRADGNMIALEAQLYDASADEQ